MTPLENKLSTFMNTADCIVNASAIVRNDTDNKGTLGDRLYKMQKAMHNTSKSIYSKSFNSSELDELKNKADALLVETDKYLENYNKKHGSLLSYKRR